MNSWNLDELRAVAGVEGAFLSRWSGELVVNTVRRAEVASVEASVSTITALVRAVQSAAGESIVLAFDFGSVQVRALTLELGVLCVLIRPECDRRLLEVVMRIISRRLTSCSESARSSRPPQLSYVAGTALR